MMKTTKGEKEKIVKTFSADSQAKSLEEVALSKSILSIPIGIVIWLVKEIKAVENKETYRTNKYATINNIALLIVSLKYPDL